MPNPMHADDTTAEMTKQVEALVSDVGEREVAPRLPKELEVQAKKLGALQRKRGLSSAAQVVRALLAYVLCAPSFRRLGMWAVLIGLADQCGHDSRPARLGRLSHHALHLSAAGCPGAGQRGASLAESGGGGRAQSGLLVLLSRPVLCGAAHRPAAARRSRPSGARAQDQEGAQGWTPRLAGHLVLCGLGRAHHHPAPSAVVRPGGAALVSRALAD